MTHPFLTATWSNLCLFNYAVPQELLHPYLVPGLELDTLSGQAFVSLVAFDFLNTRVMGIPIPGFRNFPEINLRFYVRRNGQRGVKFIREFVPSSLIAGVARMLYDEPYIAAKMVSEATQDAVSIKLAHHLHYKSTPHTISIDGKKPTVVPNDTSTEHFFKEHEWGFGVNRKGQLIRYRVEHPIWDIYRVTAYDIRFDFVQLYGDCWKILNTAEPHSVILAKGSQVSVYPHLVEHDLTEQIEDKIDLEAYHERKNEPTIPIEKIIPDRKRQSYMPFATIDIGTNAVLLLIGEKTPDGKIKSIYEEAQLTRLGQGLGSAHILHPDGMQRTLDVLKSYADTCIKFSAAPIVAVGTSAFRRAQNADEFVEQVRQETGIAIQIISGDEEATLSFEAARAEFGENIIVVDIGGGSTEFIWQNGMDPGSPDQVRGRLAGVALHTQSLLLGAVTLQENFGRHDPLDTQDAVEMEAAVLHYLDELPKTAVAETTGKTMVGIAGTVTTLAAMALKLKKYDHAQVHGHVLTLADVEVIISDLLPLSIEDRKKLPGLEPKRADVIYPGAVILQAAMEHFGKDKIITCHHGIRWGLGYRI